MATPVATGVAILDRPTIGLRPRSDNVDFRTAILLRIDSGLFRDFACATLLAVEQH